MWQVTTAILAPFGASRSRLLRNLYGDERTKSLKNFDMLERMFKARGLMPCALA